MGSVPIRATRRTPKILVVDDDPGLLRLLTIRLRAEKYEVEPADSAAKALSVITRFRPDLVITDLRMAEMDGIAAMDASLRNDTPRLGLWLDTSDLTVEATVDAIVARGLADGRVA